MTNEEDAQEPKVSQFELDIKLERIFMPHARKQRDAFYKKLFPLGEAASSSKFVHYTSAEAALSIIKSKCVWMRNSMCMSDYSEVQHGFNILHNFFANNSKLSALISILDSCTPPGAATAAIEAFNSWWSDIRLHTYIASISEHDSTEDLHGRLSMWRAFGNSTSRVAIVINVPWASDAVASLKLMFSPVAYLTETEFVEVFNDVLVNVQTNRDFLSSLKTELIIATVFNMLVSGVTCLKHEGFKEEREWRAIYSPIRSPSNLIEPSIEAIDGVPQPIYKIPLDEKKGPSSLEFSRIFDSLIIGPTQYATPMFDAFNEALINAGVVNPRVSISGIPIRT